MYFIVVKDRKSGNIIDKNEIDNADLSGDVRSQMEILSKAVLSKIEERYPRNDFEVLQGEAEDYPAFLRANGLIENRVFSISASRSSLIWVNVGGFIGGSVIGGVCSIFLGPAVFVTVVLCLAIYFTADFFIWLKRGIRKLELTDKTLDIYRGHGSYVSRIPLESIRSIDRFRKLSRQVVNIMIGGEALKPVPGITFFRGPRIRIVNDAFSDKEFDEFIKRLSEIVQ